MENTNTSSGRKPYQKPILESMSLDPQDAVLRGSWSYGDTSKKDYDWTNDYHRSKRDRTRRKRRDRDTQKEWDNFWSWLSKR